MSELDQALADAQAHLVRLQAEIERVEVEVAGLETAIARRDSRETTLSNVTPEASAEWLRLSRVDAIVRMLREHVEPLSPNHLAHLLQEQGRDDSSAVVSASLSYLKTAGRVESVGRGRWVAAQEGGTAP